MSEAWFRLADQDGDGAVGGAEAVRFFTRSGLPQDVLGQIWEYASRGQPALNPIQFMTALRLVALAQASGGRLPPDQARLVAMGSGPQLPPPRLAGLTETPPTPSIPTYTPQITGLTPQVTGTAAGGGGAHPYAPQMTGGMPGGYTPQATGARPPYPYPMQPPPSQPGAMQAAAAAAGPTGSGPPSAGMVAQLTGGPVSGGYTGAPAAAPAAAAGLTGAGVGGPVVYPPGFSAPSAADMQRYHAVFVSTDGDRDGLVKGSECFPVFMQSGLDKGVLKRMWDLVAGNAGHLSRDQFVRAMFLMDGLRRGLALPTVLPPGPWPQVAAPAAAAAAAAGGMTGTQPAGAYQQPVAAGGGLGSRPGSMGGAVPGLQGVELGGSRPGSMGGAAPLPAGGGFTGGPGPLRAESWSLSSQFGHKGAVKAISDAYDQTLPKIPEPPGKVKYEGAAVPDSGPSAVPDLDVTVASMLAPADKARWEAERAEALKKEAEQRRAEAEATNQKARLALYQEALSELVMFKSKIDVALLQAGDSATRLEREAEDLELRYNRAQLAAQSQADAGSKARKQLQDLLARKAEAITRLQVLQQELEMANNLNPEELVALEREVGGLMAQQAAAEARKAALDMQLDSGRKQKGLLSERISELEMASVAGEGEMRRAREELEQLQGKVLSSEAACLSPDELGEVKPLLGKAASAYRRLYSTAAAAGIEVPYEANINNVGALVWLEQLMAGTADWVEDDTLSGYSVVNALPELEGVPPALLRAAALAAAAAPPLKPTSILQGKTPAAADTDQGADAAAAAAGDAADKEAAPAAEAAEAAAPEAAAAADKDAKEAAPKGDKEATASEPAAAAAAAVAKDSSSGAEAKSSTTTSKAAGVAAAAAATAAVAAAGAGAAAAGVVSSSRKGSQEEQEAAAAAAPAVEPETAAAGGLTAADADLPASTEAPAAAAEAAAEADADVAAAAAAEGSSVAAGFDAAEAVHSPPPPPAAAAAEGGEGAATPPADVASPPAAAAPKSLLDDSDSEAGGHDTPQQQQQRPQPFAAAAAGSDSEGLAAAAPAFGGLGLASFDPSLYRLPDEQRGGGLVQQHSIDSSYAGSFTADRRRSSIEAGATGASASASGLEDDAPVTAAGSGAGGGGGSGAGGGAAGSSSGAAGLGFEDNAF